MALPSLTKQWQRQLTELGFAPGKDGEGYRRNDLLFTASGVWTALYQTQPLADAGPLVGHLGKPGLWKCVRAAGAQGVRWLFDLPPGAWQGREEGEDAEEENTPQANCLSWATATAGGSPPAGWEPPARETVESWVAPSGLTVRCGSLVRQGELVHGPRRLALRFPLVPRIPDDLPPSRERWLRQVLQAGQERWRMVRIGLAGDGPRAALAEVDLSGCPRPVLESVFGAGLAALRWVVEWLVPCADFLADSQVSCAALDVR